MSGGEDDADGLLVVELVSVDPAAKRANAAIGKMCVASEASFIAEAQLILF